jgi:hypothetical protein
VKLYHDTVQTRSRTDRKVDAEEVSKHIGRGDQPIGCRDVPSRDAIGDMGGHNNEHGISLSAAERLEAPSDAEAMVAETQPVQPYSCGEMSQFVRKIPRRWGKADSMRFCRQFLSH